MGIRKKGLRIGIRGFRFWVQNLECSVPGLGIGSTCLWGSMRLIEVSLKALFKLS